MEVYPDFLVWAAPAGLVLVIVELIWHRRLLPLLTGIAGLLLGLLSGVAVRQWLLTDGSLEEVILALVIASVGALVGVLAGIAISARTERRSRRSPLA